MKDLEAVHALEQFFGSGKPVIVARAPGRVNLIGEHTDYNQGLVLPFAIDRYTEVALRPRKDWQIRIFSESFKETVSLTLPLKHPQLQRHWSDYLIGILREFSKITELPYGFEASIVSTVPLRAGLSSSASLEVAFALGVSLLYKTNLAGLELVKLCQRAENEFVGMPCGIMDQYVAYFAQPRTALLLDTRALTHQLVPLHLEGFEFLVVDSMTRRSLSHSRYSERRKECEEATRWFSKHFPERKISSLRDVDSELVEEVAREMPSQLWRRARHVVAENARVLLTVEALKKGKAQVVGALLLSSHESLRDLFEVSTPELDFLVEWGMSHGALGARLIGGGFGGVTLHLVPSELSRGYVEELQEAYLKKFGLKAEIVPVRPATGASAMVK